MLPDEKTAWPPPAVKPYYGQIARWADWYGDDTDALYPARSGNDYSFDRDSRRWFRKHGHASAGSEQIGQAHVPLAADIARTSADLLFGEMPTFSPRPLDPNGTPDPKVQDRINDLTDRMGLGAALVEGAELCAALSAIYWRMTYDPAVIPDRPIPTWVQPDMAVPEWTWGQLTAVTIWSVLPTPPGAPDTGTWRHLERHSTGFIEHGLYVGDGDTLGRRVDLSQHPATAGIVLTGPDFIALPAGIPMTAGYIPNMRPNRILRTGQLGRADIQGIEKPDGPLAGLDKTWSSWMRDLDLGKGRAIVPAEFLQDGGAGQGATFNLDRAVYDGLRMPPQTSGSPITVMQFAIRVDEHARTAAEQFATVVRSAGYSLGSFGVQGEGPAITATEQRARNGLSMTTREKKTRYWSPGLQQFWSCLLAMDSVMFNGPATLGQQVDVVFPPGVADAPEQVATTVNLLAQAQAASTATKVAMVHPDWDGAQIAAEVALIQADATIAVPDPIGGGESNGFGSGGEE